jgi:RHS repeat-associated protein
VTQGSSVTWRRTVAGVAVMALAGTTAGIVNNTRTLLHDHIGSVVADATTGALAERADYAAFGGMRTAIDGVAVGLAALTTTTRGFIGHEELGSLDLIHMNGRIYDPMLGRFLQADPMVGQPSNPQNWNPYSYVFNNPLANTDPTGMFSVRQTLGMVIGIVAAIISQQYWAIGTFARPSRLRQRAASCPDWSRPAVSGRV